LHALTEDQLQPRTPSGTERQANAEFAEWRATSNDITPWQDTYEYDVSLVPIGDRLRLLRMA